MRARTVFKSDLPMIHEGEALILLEAIEWLVELEVDHVYIEMDSSRVVQGLNSLSMDASEYGFILSNCRQLFSNLPNFHVSFVKRQANLVAHSLARAAADFACY